MRIKYFILSIFFYLGLFANDINYPCFPCLTFVKQEIESEIQKQYNDYNDIKLLSVNLLDEERNHFRYIFSSAGDITKECIAEVIRSRTKVPNIISQLNCTIILPLKFKGY